MSPLWPSSNLYLFSAVPSFLLLLYLSSSLFPPSLIAFPPHFHSPILSSFFFLFCHKISFSSGRHLVLVLPALLSICHFYCMAISLVSHFRFSLSRDGNHKDLRSLGFFLEITNIWQTSRDFWFIDCFLGIFKIQRLV